ncbi:hypothetical protein MBLNU230_g5918t1 [Neophaeotheca triangularis]
MISFKAIVVSLSLALLALASPLKTTISGNTGGALSVSSDTEVGAVGDITARQDAAYALVCDACDHYEISQSIAYAAAELACAELSGQELGSEDDGYTSNITTSVVVEEFTHISNTGTGRFAPRFNFATLFDGGCTPIESTSYDACLAAFDGLFQGCSRETANPESTFTGWYLDGRTCVTYQSSSSKGGLGAPCDALPLTEPPTDDDGNAIAGKSSSTAVVAKSKRDIPTDGQAWVCNECESRPITRWFRPVALREACESLVGFDLGPLSPYQGNLTASPVRVFVGDDWYPIHYNVLYQHGEGCEYPGFFTQEMCEDGFGILEEQCSSSGQGWNLDTKSCITYQINASPDGLGTQCD